jgi:hypothetical protein
VEQRITITLKKPVTIGGKDGRRDTVVSELHFRSNVEAGDMRGIRLTDEPMTFDEMIKVGGRLCGQPDVIMFKLDLKDARKVVTLVSGFLADGLEIGSEVSE